MTDPATSTTAAINPLLTEASTSVSAAENAAATNSGTYQDGTVSVSGPGVTDNHNGTWSWSGTGDEDHSYDVTVTATGSHGGVSTKTFHVSFTDVAPAVAATYRAVSGPESAAVTNTGTFSDYDDVVTITASTGTISQTAGTNGSWTWSGTGDVDNPYTVTITATNADHHTSTTTFNVSYTEVAPTITTNYASVSAVEGSTVSNTGSFSEPLGVLGTSGSPGDPNRTITLSVLSGPGTVTPTTPAQSGTWTWSYANAPQGTYNVVIGATDSDGDFSTVSFTVTATDAPLSSSPSNLTPPTAYVGVALSNVVVFHFTDGNTAKPTSAFTATITPGDGGTIAGTVVFHNGSNGTAGYDVLMSHTYSSALHNKVFGVLVVDNAGGSTHQSISTFNVINAQTDTWMGTTSNWSTPGNWSLGVVPSANYDVTIPSGGTQPVLTAAATVHNLTIQSGASLTLAGNNLTVGGTFSNLGTFILQGNETISGTPDYTHGTWQYVGDGSGGTITLLGGSYNNLAINDTHGMHDTFKTNSALAIAGTFQVTSGIYNANGQTTTVTGLTTVGGTYQGSTASQTFNGGLSLADAAANNLGAFYESGSGTVSIAGNLTETNSGVFNDTSSGAVTISGAVSLTSSSFSDTGTGNVSMASLTLTTSTFGVTGGGNISLTSTSDIALTGSSIYTGSGTLTLNGDVTTNASSTTSTISGKVDLGGANRTFTVNSGSVPSGGADLAISANISSASISTGSHGYSLTKAGSGILNLSGNNSYGGFTGTLGSGNNGGNQTTLLTAGTLALSGSSGSAIPSLSTVVLSNASGVILDVQSNQTMGTLFSATNSINSAQVELESGATLSVGFDNYSTGGSFGYFGTISGMGNLSKVGTGILHSITRTRSLV